MNIKRLSLLLLTTTFSLFGKINVEQYTKDPHTTELEVTFQLKPREYVYKENLFFEIDHPSLSITTAQTNTPATQIYDHTSKQHKNVYKDTVTFHFNVTKKTESTVDDAHLHISYVTNVNDYPEETVIPLSFAEHTNTEVQQTDAAHVVEQPTYSASTAPTKKKSWSATISHLIENNDSLLLRLLLVLLLGILLSLTPCIYPMIPITAGILQAQGSRSLYKNFLLALSYSFGMATTFALMGLLAGATGPVYGKLLMQPLFIAGLVIILGYLAFSMIGLYELRLPQFSTQNFTKKGSYLSTFIFGAASGTIASPCVSPGLALLLSVVATLGNALLGFLLLFVFGIGLSTPLLLVGTFSSSLNVLPQAGMWMVEVKRFFGFMMLAMCLYYLNYVVPFWIILWLSALLSLAIGLYYLVQAHKPGAGKKTKYTLGVTLIAIGVLLIFQAAQTTLYPAECSIDRTQECWFDDYQEALEHARSTNQKLFIDFWAQYCSICIAINNKVLTQPVVNQALNQMTALKVDGTFATNKPFDELQEKYKITGFPVFLLIDPINETVIKKWGGELYDMDPEEFAHELHKLLSNSRT